MIFCLCAFCFDLKLNIWFGISCRFRIISFVWVNHHPCYGLPIYCAWKKVFLRYEEFFEWYGTTVSDAFYSVSRISISEYYNRKSICLATMIIDASRCPDCQLQCDGCFVYGTGKNIYQRIKRVFWHAVGYCISSQCIFYGDSMSRYGNNRSQKSFWALKYMN